MKITFDPVKNKQNIAKHGLSLDAFELLDASAAIYVADKRREYGEERIKMFAPLWGRLCVAVFTMRDGEYRIISLRKANKRERRLYEAQAR